MKLYMCVTKDEYELPLFVTPYALEMSEKTGTCLSSIRKSVCMNGKGTWKHTPFRYIEVEDFEMNEWVYVDEDLPMLRPGLKNISVDVLAKLKTGEEAEAFYAYNQRKWFDSNNGKVLKKVIAWQSLKQ